MHFRTTQDMIRFLRSKSVEPKQLNEPEQVEEQIEEQIGESADDGEVLQAD